MMAPQLLLGPFTEADRTDFMNKYALEYLQRHPNERPSFARKQARQAWRNHVRKALREQPKEVM